MKQSLRGFLAALSFMTRLGPALRHEPALLASALPWFAPVGLGVGLFCALPVGLGLFAACPLVQAWLYALLNFWVTRGLHLDGLADLADSWGSGASGDKFWNILRDSRCGAFGAMALALAVGGYVVLAHGLILSGHMAALILAPAFGRAAVPALAACTRPRDPQSLGGLVFAGAGFKLALCSLAGVFLPACFFLSPGKALLALALFAAILAWLALLARKNGGANGDFFGCAIVCCELAAMLAALA